MEGMTITFATPHAPLHVKKGVSSIVLPGMKEKLFFVKISFMPTISDERYCWRLRSHRRSQSTDISAESWSGFNLSSIGMSLLIYSIYSNL